MICIEHFELVVMDTLDSLNGYESEGLTLILHNTYASNCLQDSSPACAASSGPGKAGQARPITGVIGASFSGVSIMVANILRLFKVSLSHYNDAEAVFLVVCDPSMN
jgi:hypothetical protein